MSFAATIQEHYAKAGGDAETHVFPFIGSAYESPRADQLRVVAVGFNSYISPQDWPKDRTTMPSWLRDWWRNARHGSDTWPFYNRAFDQVTQLAAGVHALAGWQTVTPDLEPASKASLYARNAVKVYTREDMKRSDAIPQELLERFTRTWNAELVTMADHDCLPHLVMVFGAAIWEPHWRSLHPAHADKGLGVESYVDVDGPAAGHAVRVELRPTATGRPHTVLLVRLHHPSARSLAKRDAAWLLRQQEFVALAGQSRTAVVKK